MTWSVLFRFLVWCAVYRGVWARIVAVVCMKRARGVDSFRWKEQNGIGERRMQNISNMFKEAFIIGDWKSCFELSEGFLFLIIFCDVDMSNDVMVRNKNVYLSITILTGWICHFEKFSCGISLNRRPSLCFQHFGLSSFTTKSLPFK